MKLMRDFRNDTRLAIDNKISTNPILNAFQKVVHGYGIEWELIDAFLNSMEMDLTESSYERAQYDNYIYGSAEVVGLMCLRVFTKNDNLLYDELKEPAKMLGSAFQKVNFLRDIKSDLNERGRIYLPNVHNEFLINNKNKKALEKEIADEFKASLAGIKKLPIGVKLGVYSAYLYFFMLFKKIEKLDVDTLLNKRVRISNFRKLGLLLKSIIEVKVLKVT
jgi:phytoene/squalene synthetase